MKKLGYYFSFIPFQLNFFVLSFIVSSTYLYLRQEYITEKEPTYFITLIETLFLFVVVFSLSILGLALLTTCISWVFFLVYKKSSSLPPVQATLGEGAQAQAGFVSLGMTAKGILKPLLGHVKSRIVFSDQSISPALALDQPQYTTSRIIRSSIKAGRPVWIPEIKEHEVTKIVLYFEDMFRLVSIPFVITNVQKLLTIPAESPSVNVEVSPDKTVEQEQRIQTPKRIQGELFNYKNFEAGDDIRRIVWKIYAKNKELVVKIPEIMDPYASHIYFYPSFYKAFTTPVDIQQAMLNYYKVKIRQVYEALGKSDFSLKYVPDQEVEAPDNDQDENPVWLYQLSTSLWQPNKEVTDVIHLKKEGVFCISSLVPMAEVEELFHTKSPDTLVIFIKLSDMWKHQSAFNLFSLFVKTEEHPLNSLKRKWIFLSGKKKILQNETKIQKYLEDQLFKFIQL